MLLIIIIVFYVIFYYWAIKTMWMILNGKIHINIYYLSMLIIKIMKNSNNFLKKLISTFVFQQNILANIKFLIAK